LTDWDPALVERSPMFEPLREHAHALRAHSQWPHRDVLQALLDARGISNVAGTRLRLVDEKWGQTRFFERASAGVSKIESDPIYEERLRLLGEMPFREGGWHDLFNVLAWLAYPKAKATLNDAHYGALVEERAGGAPRGPRRDALTVFDESGAIVLAADASLLEDLRAFRWKRLFVERRAEVVAAMRVHVFGHALFEKALKPYVGMTAHAMLFAVSTEVIRQPLAQRLAAADALASQALREVTSPRDLSPLPVLGVPGWYAGNQDARFYDDASYFRNGRKNAR
jgi:hypothetical protein